MCPVPLTVRGSDWAVDSVTNMDSMFARASAFNQPLGGWRVDKVTNMRVMFLDASAFNQPLGGWRVDKVTASRPVEESCCAIS